MFRQFLVDAIKGSGPIPERMREYVGEHRHGPFGYQWYWNEELLLKFPLSLLRRIYSYMKR